MAFQGLRITAIKNKNRKISSEGNAFSCGASPPPPACGVPLSPNREAEYVPLVNVCGMGELCYCMGEVPRCHFQFVKTTHDYRMEVNMHYMLLKHIFLKF